MTANKPSPNHPWKTAPRFNVSDWAKKQAEVSSVNNWKQGGGMSPWNK